MVAKKIGACVTKAARIGAFAAAAGILGGSAAALSGCRVTDDDIHRWGQTQHGPEKLVAVVTHDKYSMDQRVAAALDLIKMKPRSGQRVGIKVLVEQGLASLAPEERKRVVEGMVPAMAAEMKRPPPAAQAGQQAPPDPSYPFKDAAFAMLTYDKAPLVADEARRKDLIDALVQWCSDDFEHRLENSSQMYGMEQVMRFIGAPAVKSLPDRIDNNSTKYDRIAKLVAELGDGPTKEAASKKLVELAKYTTSPAWVDKMKPVVEEANRQAKLAPKPDQFQKQLDQYQDEALLKVFDALRRVGARPAIEYCLAVAADKAQKGERFDKRRQAALAAIENRLDKNNPADVQRVLAIASDDDTPDSVRDQAFSRVGELPRDTVIEKLYALFAHKKWKVRWVAAATVLKMSNTTQIAEFMGRLPGGAAPGFAMTEPLSYGGYLAKVTVKDNKHVRETVLPFLTTGPLASRLTAIGYLYAEGKPSDVSLLQPLMADRTPIPKTDDAEAKWQCGVPKAPGSKETEVKELKTVGDFVTFCIEPAVKGRT